MKNIFAVFFMGALFFSPAAGAQPKENTVVEYYDIQGNSKKDLIKEMKKKGVHENGKRFHAHTDWLVSWKYQYAPAADGCRIFSVVTDLEISFFLPRWVPGPGVSSGLVEKWENYYAALKTHEDGHADIGRKAAREIDEALGKLGRGLSCPQVREAADQEAERILKIWQKENADYDVRTKNGRKQGAVFD